MGKRSIEKIWTVYRLIYAGETYYIGMTTRPLQERLRGHLRATRNNALRAWLASLPTLPETEALEVVTGTQKQAGRRECEYVYRYLASGAPLLNIAYIRGDRATLQRYLRRAAS